MKRFFTLFFLIFCMVSVTPSQTVLAPGDLALLGVNCDNPDDFAFLLLADISPGTEIKFTDNGWLSTGGFRGGEGTRIFTAASFYSAGAVLVYSLTQAEFTQSGSFALSSSGDQLLCYQGDDASPSMLYAINIEGAAEWQPDATSTNTSALPVGLVNGFSAVAVEESDNVKYDGSTNFSNPQAALIAISDTSNWIGDDTTPYDFSIWGDFSLPVQLSSFTASAGDREVVLRWVTESERDNAGFEVFRSLDSDTGFQMISSYMFNPGLQGRVNSNTRHEYQFRDQVVMNDETYWYQLVDVNITGQRTYYGPLSATPHATGNEVLNQGGSNFPQSYRLYQNFPNPFNPRTTLYFDIPDIQAESMTVSLNIYNAVGQLVSVLYQGKIAPGNYSTEWDVTNQSGVKLSSGIYYAVLKAKYFTQTIKMVFIG
jgi:hypothetical protein